MRHSHVSIVRGAPCSRMLSVGMSVLYRLFEASVIRHTIMPRRESVQPHVRQATS